MTKVSKHWDIRAKKRVSAQPRSLLFSSSFRISFSLVSARDPGVVFIAKARSRNALSFSIVFIKYIRKAALPSWDKLIPVCACSSLQSFKQSACRETCIRSNVLRMITQDVTCDTYPCSYSITQILTVWVQIHTVFLYQTYCLYTCIPLKGRLPAAIQMRVQ